MREYDYSTPRTGGVFHRLVRGRQRLGTSQGGTRARTLSPFYRPSNMPGLLPPRGQRPAWPPEPFDDKLPTHPLLIVDYQAVKAGEQEAIDTLYQACSNLGFFYLKNHGVDPEPVFEVGEDTFALPLDELMEFEQGDSGRSAGFKAAGVNNVDAHGNRDTGEYSTAALCSSAKAAFRVRSGAAGPCRG